jgi:hypothetical protein
MQALGRYQDRNADWVAILVRNRNPAIRSPTAADILGLTIRRAVQGLDGADEA